jgi:hypothetical protein
MQLTKAKKMLNSLKPLLPGQWRQLTINGGIWDASDHHAEQSASLRGPVKTSQQRS